MKTFIVTSLAICTALISCNSHEKVRAKVFERKQITEGRLLIRYSYIVDDKSFTDSANVQNISIDHDSIDVIINPENPQKSLPDLH